MENASKALTMAGGILIALLIIGALILMVNQIGDYEKGQNNNDKNSELASFHKTFEKYADDKGIKGVDIVSLINKILDYNQIEKDGGIKNSVNYDIKMSITISGLKAFNKKYAYDKQNDNDSLFPNSIGDSWTFGANSTNNKTTNGLKQLLDEFSRTESNIGIEQMKKLSSIYDPSKSESTNKASIKEKLLEINSNEYKNWNGTTTPTLNAIKKYRQYSEFKTSTFIAKDSEYEDGQIKNMYFEFSK